MSTTAFLPNY